MAPLDCISKSLRVLHTEWSMGWGGQEIRILEEMKAFRALGVDMELACRPNARIESQALKANFVVHHVPFRNRIHPSSILEIRRILRSGSFSLIHTHSSIDSWCGGMAGRLSGIPVIRSRHLSATVKPGLNARIVYDWLPDAVIASGRHIRDHLVSQCHCRPEKHFSIPAGADQVKFSPDIDATSVITEFNLASVSPIIGIVAVLRSWKGHRILLDACSRILTSFPEMRILVVGDGPLREHLPAWARDFGLDRHILLTGHRDDIPSCMKAMDVCVLPSLKNEATSQVMPQAMLVGTPVICSSAGGLTEVVQDGLTGRIVAPGDAEELAKALLNCFADQEKTRQMAIAAREYALAHLTFNEQIRKTLDVYKYILQVRARDTLNKSAFD